MTALIPRSLRWFEPVFVRILQHEYRAAMRFDSTATSARLPQPASAPCQLYVHVPRVELAEYEQDEAVVPFASPSRRIGSG